MLEDNLIEVSQSNLYQNGTIIIFDNGEKELVRDRVEWKGSVNDTYYRVRQNDFIDLIAYNVYKDLVENPEFYWWLIADANDIENSLDISEFVGQEILIPDIFTFLLTL